MLPAAFIDLSFQPSTSSRLERSDWVDMQLAESFMLDTKRSMPASFVVTWIMAAVLYKAAPAIQLATWLALANLVILCRYVVAVQFQNTMREVSGPELRSFLNKYDILWILGGLLWGVSALLFFGRATGFEQFICGLILVGVSCFSVYSYSSRLKCYFGFSNAMTGTTLAIFIYCMWVDKSLSSISDNLGLIGLTVIFQLMVRYFAVRFHVLQRKSLLLQFDNGLLIQSLTAKSTAALEAVENKNRFIASAAHDLRQPVHALNLYASWLVDEPDLSQQVAPHIVRCTRAVNDLFNSLFDFSGLNAEVTKVDWQQVDLADVLADLKHQYAPLAREKGLQLRLRSKSCWVRTDPVLLKRMLGNVISNALKNTRQGGVLLALRMPAGRWRIDVWDTGVGIETRYQQAIFKEFYRVPRVGSEDGFGLGLAIARRLSQLLGQTLNVQSKAGRGSVFWLEGTAEPIPTIN